MNERTPNYFGIAGAIIAAVGMFMPCVDFWYVQMSMVDILSESNAGILVVPLLLLLGFSAYLFFRGRTEGRWIGLLLLIIVLIFFFSDIGSSGEETFVDTIAETILETTDMIGSGLWVMIIALLLMILAPNLKDLWSNRAYSNPPTERSGPQRQYKPAAVLSSMWSCPHCKNINSGTTDICFACGKKRSQPVCPACGKELQSNSTFCGNCGVNLEDARRQKEEREAARKEVAQVDARRPFIVCPACGTECPEDNLFCGNCGLNLKEVLKNKEEKRVEEERFTQREEAERRKQLYLCCPACGSETPKGENICQNCGAALSNLYAAMGKAYLGVWVDDENINNNPRHKLVIHKIENGVMDFTLEKYATYKLKDQQATITSQKDARFRTTDGTVAGKIYLNNDSIIVQIDASVAPAIRDGDVYTFFGAEN